MNDSPSNRAGDDSEPLAGGSRRSALGWLRQAIRLLQVRARFVVVLLAIAVVVGQWERIGGYWDWATRRLVGAAGRESAVSPDTEFFCPMDPGVISPWEDKCPICNMALVRRKKGDAVLLPEGVVARMQVSPYRLQLAGIRPVTLDYRPLVKEVTAVGFVQTATQRAEPVSTLSPSEVASSEVPSDSPPLEVAIRVTQQDLPFLSLGQMAEVRIAPPEVGPAQGRLASIAPRLDPQTGNVVARLQLLGAAPGWRPGALATARFRTPLAEVQPYRMLARRPPPLREGELRIAFVSSGHPEVVRDKPGRCPLDKTELIEVPLTDNQRLDWWCPMHPAVTADRAGHACAQCNGMILLPRIVSYSPPGEVLAVPRDAVIDTGHQQWVYVETAPGMFDGVVVTLGSRAGEYYPVLKGLTAGQRVVGAGTFLLDAETRLNSQAATAYFGAGAAHDGQ